MQHRRLANMHTPGSCARRVGDPMLAYQSPTDDADRPRLIWAVAIEYRTPEGEVQNSSARIDAVDGSLVLLHPLEHRVK